MQQRRDDDSFTKQSGDVERPRAARARATRRQIDPVGRALARGGAAGGSLQQQRRHTRLSLSDLATQHLTIDRW